MLYQEAVMIKILLQYLLLRFMKMKMWMTECILCTLLNAGWDTFHHYYNGTKVVDLVSNTLDLCLGDDRLKIDQDTDNPDTMLVISLSQNILTYTMTASFQHLLQLIIH